MNRRVLATLGLFAVLASGSILPATAAAKPDILSIAADDLNDRAGVPWGHPQTVTPEIHQFARRGTLFTYLQLERAAGS